MVGNVHDAEDAFQATFLVLVRRAASIASRDRVANWLYGVAHRTALKARQTAARRRARERQGTEMPEPEARPSAPDPWRDLRPLLDREVARLPDRYRAALVLCDLEGKNRREAARQLGLPEGTVGSRLARARSLLAKRLARYESAGEGAPLALLAHELAQPSVPPAVLSATLRAVTSLASGQATPGLIAAPVVALTEGVIRAMILMKINTAVVVLSIAGLLVFTGWLTLPGRTAPPPQAEKPPPEPARAVTDGHPKPAGKPAPALEGKREATPFRVTIEPVRDKVRVGARFRIRVRVTNESASVQSFDVANGSWEEHWKSSNDRVHWVPRAVFRNFMETVKLEPGQTYEKTGELFVTPGPPLREVRFKLGFAPRGAKQTYWSNEVTLPIE